MRVVKDETMVELSVGKEELLEGKYISYKTVSSKLKAKEEEGNMLYKALRVKFYNATAMKKFNMIEKFEQNFIDTEKPMKDGVKSPIVLSFKVV